MKITDERAAEIAARAEAQHGLPWRAYTSTLPARVKVHENKCSCRCGGTGRIDVLTGEPDAVVFAAYARADIPDLLADRAELLAALRKYGRHIGCREESPRCDCVRRSVSYVHESTCAVATKRSAFVCRCGLADLLPVAPVRRRRSR